MANITRKALHFDLSTDALKQYYPKDNHTRAYKDIESFLTKNGFIHIQGSGYETEKPTSRTQIDRLVKKMVFENPWIAYCVKDCRVTDIGRSHILTKDIEKYKDPKAVAISSDMMILKKSIPSVKDTSDIKAKIEAYRKSKVRQEDSQVKTHSIKR